MPSTSVKQRNFFQIVLKVKTGKMKRNEVDKKVLDIVDSDMTLEEIKDMASTSDKEIEKTEKTNESLSLSDKESITKFVKNFKGEFDDKETHEFAKKNDLNVHEVEAFIYSLARKGLNEDKVSGGKGDKISEKDVDPKEFAVGVKVEMEHTDDESIAKEIALDHLEEVPNYYTRLIKSGLVDEEPALKKYKELFNDDPSKYLKETANQLSPSTVNGMGEVALPAAPLSMTEFGKQAVGSGDTPYPKKKRKKVKGEKKKMIFIQAYDKFSGNKNA